MGQSLMCLSGKAWKDFRCLRRSLWDTEQLGKDVGYALGLGELGIKTGCDLEVVVPEADVVIDFSYMWAQPVMPIAWYLGTRLVIGTTGYTEEELEMIDGAAATIPIVRSGNMSLGVNLLAHWLKLEPSAERARYDLEVIERHHRHKVDARAERR